MFNLRSAAAVLAVGAMLSASAAAGELREVGSPFRDFLARGMDGTLLSAGRYRGKVVLIDFWASWCGPCRADVAALVELYRRYRDQGFEIVGINLDTDLDALEEFLRANEMDWPQVADGLRGKSALADRYGVDGIPDTILIDRSGRVVGRGLRGRDLAAAVARLVDVPPRTALILPAITPGDRDGRREQRNGA